MKERVRLEGENWGWNLGSKGVNVGGSKRSKENRVGKRGMGK
jgi:hypothetical protein